MFNYVENNLSPSESIVFKARKSWVLMVRHILVGVILVAVGWCVPAENGGALFRLLCVLGAVALVGYNWVALRVPELVVTNRRIVGKDGLISRRLMECPLSKVDSVSMENNLLGAIFGYGTVVVSAVSGTFTYDHIADASRFRNEIICAIDAAGNPSMRV